MKFIFMKFLVLTITLTACLCLTAFATWGIIEPLQPASSTPERIRPKETSIPPRESSVPYFSYTGLKASLNQKMATRTGPNTKYTEPGTFAQSTSISVFYQTSGNGVMWGMVEFKHNGEWYRLYTGMKRINSTSIIPKDSEDYINVYLKSSVVPKYGPGERYAIQPDKLPSVGKVKAYYQENGYVMVDYEGFDQVVRGWIPLSSLEIENNNEIVNDVYAIDRRFESVLPIKSYLISKDRVTTYKGINQPFNSVSYIDGKKDECVIEEVYTSGWVKVTYPIKNGKKTAYCYLSDFIDPLNAVNHYEAGVKDKTTTYQRNDLSKSYGWVWKDQFRVVAEKNNACQIIYPIDAGGWKMGWIRKSQIFYIY